MKRGMIMQKPYSCTCACRRARQQTAHPLAYIYMLCGDTTWYFLFLFDVRQAVLVMVACVVGCPASIHMASCPTNSNSNTSLSQRQAVSNSSREDKERKHSKRWTPHQLSLKSFNANYCKTSFSLSLFPLLLHISRAQVQCHCSKQKWTQSSLCRHTPLYNHTLRM